MPWPTAAPHPHPQPSLAVGGGPDTGLSKVVMARRTALHITGGADPLYLLQALQVRGGRKGEGGQEGRALVL